MEMNAGGWGAVELPSTSPALGNVLEGAIQQNYRDKDRSQMYELQRLRYADQQNKRLQDEEAKKQKFLSEAFNGNEELTGVQKIDAITQKALANGYNELLAKSKTLTPAQLEEEANKIIMPLHQGDMLAKQKYVQDQARLKEYAAKNKNFDLSAATRDLQGEVGNLFLSPDESGNIKFKPIDQIDHNYDIAGKLLHPDYRHKYVLDEKQLINDLQNPKGDDWSGFHRNNRGEIVEFKTKVPVWATPPKTDASGYIIGNPSSALKTEKISSRDSKGNPVNVEYVGEGMMGNILDTDEKLDAFNSLWNKQKKANGLSFNDAKIEQIKKGEFLANLIKQNDHNQPQPVHIQQPQKWQIYPNGTSSGKGSGEGKGNGEVTINDVYSEIANLASGNPYIRPQILPAQAQEVVLKIARNASKNDNLRSDQIKIADRGDGQLQVFSTDKSGNDTYLSTLSPKSINMKVQAGVKEKRAVVEKQGNTTTPKPSTQKASVPQIKRSDIAAKAAAAGYSASEYEQLLKEKGVKIIK